MTSSSALPIFRLPSVNQRRSSLLYSRSTGSFNSSTILSSHTSDGSALFDAAKLTVDKYIKNGMVIGLGSGNASGMAIEYLGRQLRRGALKDIVGIPMSTASASEAAKVGIPLDRYHQDTSQIDFAFSDADMIEEGTLATVIGRRKLQYDESIIQEKSIIKAANNLVFMVKENIYKRSLEGSIPVLVNPINWLDVAEEIDDLFIGDAEVWRRPSIGHADPRGGDFPLVTKEGLNILVIIFTSPISDLVEVAENLDQIDGVVEHGIVYEILCSAIIASQTGIQTVENRPMNVSSELKLD